MPHPLPQYLLLPLGNQLSDWPFSLFPHGPFIPPTYLCLLLHLQCHPVKIYSHILELFAHMCIVNLLVVLSLTLFLAFSSHSLFTFNNMIGSFVSAHLAFYFSYSATESTFGFLLQPSWMSIDCCILVNNSP
jgi:hypothetical protein